MSDIKITVEERNGRKHASSGSKWEPIMGYSRAVRSGNVIAVTGCVGINADGTYSKTMAEQAARSLAIIQAAVEGLGGKLEHIIRTRMFVTDVSTLGGSGQGSRQPFKDIRPATTHRGSPAAHRRRSTYRNRSGCDCIRAINSD